MGAKRNNLNPSCNDAASPEGLALITKVSHVGIVTSQYFGAVAGLLTEPSAVTVRRPIGSTPSY